MNEHEVSKDKQVEHPQNLIYRFDEEEDENDLKRTEFKD